MTFSRFITLFATILAAFAGDAEAKQLSVVTSFTIPADWAKRVGGTHVRVTSLIPPDSDTHTYQLGANDLRTLRDADIIILISPRLETAFAGIIDSGAGREKTLRLTDASAAERTHTHAHAGEHDGCRDHAFGKDPHIWMNPTNIPPLINRIAGTLSEKDPAHADDYKKNAENYIAEIMALDAESKEKLAMIPPAKRILLSGHRNLDNFAERYGFKTPAAVIDSGTTEAPDTSAGKLRALIQTAKKLKTPIFYDISANKNLIDSITREAELPSPVMLRIDSLDAPEKPAGTYLGMFRENVRKIAEALKQK